MVASASRSSSSSSTGASSPRAASGSKSPMSVASSSASSASSSSSNKSRSRSSSSSSQASSGSGSSSSSSVSSKHSVKSKSSASHVEAVVTKERKPSSSSTSSYSPRKKRHGSSHRDRERQRSMSHDGHRPSSPGYSNKIFIGRLSEKVNRSHLYEIFGLYGHVIRVDLPVDHYRGFGSRGFAFVEYKHTRDAKAAAYHMNGGRIDGQRIVVEEFNPAASNTSYNSRPRRVTPDRRPSYRSSSSRYYRRKY